MELLRPDWPAPPNVRAAMTTRAGGVSQGAFASLNLGLGADEAACVAENRRRLRQALRLPAEPGWLKQVHGAAVVRLPAVPPHSGEESRGEGVVAEADAACSTDSGVVCVVQAADCLPVLFCDDAGRCVAAAHAGWRGLSAGVLENTVRAMPSPPERLMAWLGAAIGPASFEVGPEVREAFTAPDPGAAAHFTRRSGAGAPGKALADLYGLARRRLAAAGVTRVFGGGLDTLADASRFFSHRRDGPCGRMAALVWLI